MAKKRVTAFNPGRLDKPVIVIYKTRQVSASGSIYFSETEKETWAGTYFLKGRELETKGASNFRVSVVFEMRFFEGIDSAIAISYKGKRYDVEDYREKGRNDRVQLGCVRNE